RLFLWLWINSGFLKDKPGWFGVKRSSIHQLSENKTTLELHTPFDRFDFVKNRKKFYVITSALLVAGIIILSIFRLNLGIDFTSGTRVEIDAGKPVTAEEISTELDAINLSSSDIVLSGDE